MTEKNSWITYVAVIALIVAVVALAFVMKGNVTGETIKVPTYVNGTEIYTKLEINAILANFSANNAKACNADGNCDMKKANATESLVVGNVWISPSQVNIAGGGRLYTTYLTAYTLRTPNATASGLYYVCANSYGDILSKTTPCA